LAELKERLAYHEGGNILQLRGEMPGAFAVKPFQVFAQLDSEGQPKAFTTSPDPLARKWPSRISACG
jgi:hypothetical protein